MKISRIGHSENKEKCCVISLGVGKNSFVNSLKRLEESLHRVRFEGDFIYWNESLPEGCPEHFDAPFAFKTYCFYKAKELGYKQILWMDSTTIAIRSLVPVFDDIRKHGYVFFNNNYGQTLGQWISDEALLQNGLTREEAMSIPELPCSVMGLSMQSDLARNFLDQWHLIMADGVTAKGTRASIQDWNEYQDIFWNRNNRISMDDRVKGHRCDQPAAGIVANRLGMIPYSDHLKDIHHQAKPVKRNTIILHHREFQDDITPLSQIYYRVFIDTPFLEKPRSVARKAWHQTRIKKLLKSIRSAYRTITKTTPSQH